MYSINCQVSCLSSCNLDSDNKSNIVGYRAPNLMIVDYSVGHMGSVHDSWAFWSTCTYKEQDRIFGPSEWMWADSAYPSETWSVSPFKS